MYDDLNSAFTYINLYVQAAADRRCHRHIMILPLILHGLHYCTRKSNWCLTTCSLTRVRLGTVNIYLHIHSDPHVHIVVCHRCTQMQVYNFLFWIYILVNYIYDGFQVLSYTYKPVEDRSPIWETNCLECDWTVPNTELRFEKDIAHGMSNARLCLTILRTLLKYY